MTTYFDCKIRKLHLRKTDRYLDNNRIWVNKRGKY